MFGSPKEGGGAKKRMEGFKDGTTVFRVIPPFGACEESGTYRAYVSVEFGYLNSAGFNRPFLSPRVKNYKTGMVETESEAYLRRTKLNAEKDAVTKEIKDLEAAKKPIPKELEAKKKTLVDMCKKYNSKNKHIINAIYLDGTIGAIEMPATVWKQMKPIIDERKAQGKHPVAVENGLFFKVVRSGADLDTIYQLSVYTEPVKIGEKTYQDEKTHTITPDMFDKIKAEAWDLSNLYPTVTPEQEYRIVHEGAKAVDEILGGAEKKKADAPKAEEKAEPAKEAAKETPKAAETKVETKVEEKVEIKAEEKAQAIETTATTKFNDGDDGEVQGDEIKLPTPGSLSEEDQFLKDMGL